MRILIVDNCAKSRAQLTSVFARLGCEVTAVDDGVDGLARLDDERPDVVLTDVDMPRLDGLAFMEQARSTQAGRDVRFVILSSDADPSRIERARRCGVERWLRKPSDVLTIISTVFAEAA